MDPTTSKFLSCKKLLQSLPEWKTSQQLSRRAFQRCIDHINQLTSKSEATNDKMPPMASIWKPWKESNHAADDEFKRMAMMTKTSNHKLWHSQFCGDALRYDFLRKLGESSLEREFLELSSQHLFQSRQSLHAEPKTDDITKDLQKLENAVAQGQLRSLLSLLSSASVHKTGNHVSHHGGPSTLLQVGLEQANKVDHPELKLSIQLCSKLATLPFMPEQSDNLPDVLKSIRSIIDDHRSSFQGQSHVASEQVISFTFLALSRICAQLGHAMLAKDYCDAANIAIDAASQDVSEQDLSNQLRFSYARCVARAMPVYYWENPGYQKNEKASQERMSWVSDSLIELRKLVEKRKTSGLESVSNLRDDIRMVLPQRTLGILFHDMTDMISAEGMLRAACDTSLQCFAKYDPVSAFEDEFSSNSLFGCALSAPRIAEESWKSLHALANLVEVISWNNKYRTSEALAARNKAMALKEMFPQQGFGAIMEDAAPDMLLRESGTENSSADPEVDEKKKKKKQRLQVDTLTAVPLWYADEILEICSV